MREIICKHQDRMFDTTSGIMVSSCGCVKNPRLHGGISELICNACQFREKLDEADRQVTRSLSDAYDIAELEIRPLAERTKILKTHCFKCEHCDPVSFVCGVCNCSMQVPVDEYVKYTPFHCALENW